MFLFFVSFFSKPITIFIQNIVHYLLFSIHFICKWKSTVYILISKLTIYSFEKYTSLIEATFSDSTFIISVLTIYGVRLTQDPSTVIGVSKIYEQEEMRNSGLHCRSQCPPPSIGSFRIAEKLNSLSSANLYFKEVTIFMRIFF